MGFERFQPSQSPFSTADLNCNVLLLLAVVLLTGTFLLGGVLFFHLVRSYERDSMPPPPMSTFPAAMRNIQHGISIPEASSGLDDTTINSLPIFMHKNSSVPLGSGDDEDDDDDDVHGTTSFQENECSICLGEYEDEEMVRVMPECGHSFHSSCVDGWLRCRSTCPLCRLSLDSSSTGISVAIS